MLVSVGVTVDNTVGIAVNRLDSVGTGRWQLSITVDLQSGISKERAEDGLAVLEVVVYEIDEEIFVHHFGDQLSAWGPWLVDLCPLASEFKGLVLWYEIFKSTVQ